MQFSVKQIKAGIALAGLTETGLSEITGIDQGNISKILGGKIEPRTETKRRIIRALEDRAVEFMPDGGVRPRSDVVQVYFGHAGQERLNEDRYQTALNSSNDFLYCGGIAQDDASKMLSPELSRAYAQKMQTIKHFKMRGLRPMEDKAPAYSAHIEYRVLPLAEFPPVKFYVYGGKVAIVTFAPEFTVVIINNRAMSNDYRAYFETLWQKARPYRDDPHG